MVDHNARLTLAGRSILVQRVLDGRPVAHVAKEMVVSRTCAPVVPAPSGARPGRDGGSVEAKVDEVLAARVKHREGPVELAERSKVPARTVSRIIARAGLPRLWELDPISGERIRAGRATDHRGTNATPRENCCSLT